MKQTRKNFLLVWVEKKWWAASRKSGVVGSGMMTERPKRGDEIVITPLIYMSDNSPDKQFIYDTIRHILGSRIICPGNRHCGSWLSVTAPKVEVQFIFQWLYIWLTRLSLLVLNIFWSVSISLVSRNKNDLNNILKWQNSSNRGNNQKEDWKPANKKSLLGKKKGISS